MQRYTTVHNITHTQNEATRLFGKGRPKKRRTTVTKGQWQHQHRGNRTNIRRTTAERATGQPELNTRTTADTTRAPAHQQQRDNRWNGKETVRTQAKDNCAPSPEQPRCCPGTVPVQLQYNPGKSHRYRPGTARNSSASNPAPARCRFRNKPGALGRYRPGMALVRPVYSNCVCSVGTARTQPQYSPRRISRPRNHC